MNSNEQQQSHSLPSGNEHNQKLSDNVHPQKWPSKWFGIDYDTTSIAAGTVGLVASSGVAMLAAKSALTERHMMEGGCLVTESVPSKTLIK